MSAQSIFATEADGALPARNGRLAKGQLKFASSMTYVPANTTMLYVRIVNNDTCKNLLSLLLLGY